MGDGTMLTIRKAESRDVPALFRLISLYAQERLMLARTPSELARAAGQFAVAEEDGRVVGCGALRAYTSQLGEIRSLCVEPGMKRQGIGRAITEFLLCEAQRCGMKKIFALTLTPEFFEKCGFRVTSPSGFPSKIRRARFERNTNRHPDKKTMLIALPSRARAFAFSHSSAAPAHA
jgi:amino-acid N-acetyltransferase